MQIYDQKKTSAKIVQKSDLERSWAPFGKGLGRSGASWGHFWAHFDCLLDVPNHIFLKQWSKMGSKRPFGWLLDRFWEGLGRIWMRLGRIWAFKIKAFASHGHFLNTLGVPCCLTLCYRNPRAASLRLAERHNLKFGSVRSRTKTGGSGQTRSKIGQNTEFLTKIKSCTFLGMYMEAPLEQRRGVFQ